MKKLIWMTAAFVLLSGVAWAGEVTEAQARTVADNFAKGDSALKSRTVDAVTKRGNLWIVSLKPSGHVAVSANDAAYPIAMFSDRNFAEPCADTPCAEMLRAIDSDIAQATGDTYRTTWDKLLKSRSTLRLMSLSSASTANATENEVKVSVPTAWQQCQPFNDFMPIEYASGNSINTIYRGRRFLGCVPTAYVQIMNYWQWPEVVDSDVSEELNIPAEKYEGVNPIASYTPRIKAGTAMEWDGTQSQYPLDVSDESGVSSGAYDLRGYLAEKKRQCIGRACLLSQIIAKASLKTTGTGATLAQPTYNDWYERPESIGHGSSDGNGGTDPDWYFDEVKKSLEAGIPLLVGIDVAGSDGDIGHAVVGTGWKYENDSHFYELNYGWGGGSAYYSYASIRTKLGSSISQRPKPKPMLANQPDESALPLYLSWHFPKKGWEHALTGFKVYASEYGTTLEDKTDTFDTNPGTASGDHPDTIFTGTYPGSGNESAILVVKPEGLYKKKTYYVWNEPKTLSANSSLTFRLRANDTRGIAVVLQTNVDGEGWQDAYAFERSDGAVLDWHAVTVPLTGNADGSIRFRLFVEKTASANVQWNDSNPVGYMIDDFTVTQIKSIGAVNPIEVASVNDPDARSVTITQGLNVGTRYALKVSPVFSEDTPVDSDYVPIRIVGEALDAPQFAAITSVPKNTAAPAVKEDCFRECALGRNYLYVQGSATMTDLKAYSSHPSILPDSKITVESVPNHVGRFLVSIDGSDIPALGGRQRIMLTLVGSNEYGAKAQRDLTLRLSSETAGEASVTAADLDVGGGDDSGGDEPQNPDNMCVVTFDAGTVIVEREVAIGGEVGSLPNDLVKDGYTLEGWYADTEYSEKVKSDRLVSENVTFYAHWVEGTGGGDDPGADDEPTGQNDFTEGGKTYRFCVGVNKTSGFKDVNRNGTSSYKTPGAYSLVLWWADAYKTANGDYPTGYSAPGTNPVQSDFTGFDLKTFAAGLFASAVSAAYPNAADRAAYFPATSYTANEWHGDASGDAAVKAAGRRIFAELVNGPIGIMVPTSANRTYGAVIWGCEYSEDSDGKYATVVYFTSPRVINNDLESATLGMVTVSGVDTQPGLRGFNTTGGIIQTYYPIVGPAGKQETGTTTKTYTVVFDSDGGTSFNARSVAEGGTINPLPQPTKSGFTFDGWFCSEEELTTDTEITAGKTYRAKWTAKPAPSVCDDPDAQIDGDADSGFTVTPSGAAKSIEVTIPSGIAAAKVTVRVGTDVEKITPHGATVKIVKNGHDITDYLDVPKEDGNGTIDLTKAEVKAEFRKEPLDTAKGATFTLEPSKVKIQTANTRPGLTYTLKEGTSILDMKAGDSKIGDGEPWSPTVTVSDEDSGFYTITVEK